MDRRIKLLISIGVPLTILLIPSTWIPIDNLTTVEHRFIAIFFMAALFWVLEPIPVFATSILLIAIELVMVSDKCFVLFARGGSAPDFGIVLDHKEIMATFASPIIMLFMGGFFLAMAATRYQLDINLARVLLKPFGRKPSNVLLGFMVITAIFSMFMSNTATTAMMLAILVPVLGIFEPGDKGRVAFVLGIPFAANIGGIGTPIGTPPNAIALKYLTGEHAISFGTWMSFAVPVVVIILIFAWLLLIKLYPPCTAIVNIEIKGRFRKNWKAITVYITFVMTILLWLLDFLHGMNAYVVAMLPVAIFTVTSIITAEDLKRISWDVLWLLTGGIALGTGLEKSGLAGHIIQSIPFTRFSPYVIVVAATLITITMASFMSHTATVNLLLPIMSTLGSSIPALSPLGGEKMIVLAVTFSASLAMSFAVSTPPNAMAHATGEIKSAQMFKAGTLIAVFGFLCIYLLLFILNRVHFL